MTNYYYLYMCNMYMCKLFQETYVIDLTNWAIGLLREQNFVPQGENKRLWSIQQMRGYIPFILAYWFSCTVEYHYPGIKLGNTTLFQSYQPRHFMPIWVDKWTIPPLVCMRGGFTTISFNIEGSKMDSKIVALQVCNDNG